MQSSFETVLKFKKLYEEMKRQNLFKGSKRMAEVRESAILSLEGKGFPSTKSDEWRYTNPGRLVPAGVDLNLSTPPAPVTAKTLAEWYPLAPQRSHRAVLVNGTLRPDLSSLPSKANFSVYSLATLLAGQGPQEVADRVEALWRSQEENRGQAFSWLNTALSLDGCVVVVPAGVVIDRPIEVVHVAAGRGTPSISSMIRNFFLVGASSKVTFVEAFVSSPETNHATNVVTSLCVDCQAQVHFVKAQFEGKSGAHLSALHASLDQEAELRFLQVACNGHLSRQEFFCDIKGTAAFVRADALFLVESDEHLDLRTEIRHHVPGGQSHQLIKGIAADRSRAVFNGKIVIEKDAQKVASSQLCRTLLLSKSAEIDTKPELEIYADDVKATHGATVGQLDEEQIFYLISRGIPRPEAETLLAKGFLAEVLEHYRGLGELNTQLNQLVGSWISATRGRAEGKGN